MMAHKKRYHQSFKDRMHEHSGAEKRGHGNAHAYHAKHHSGYEGMESRRHQEMRDSGMIHEDHSAIANLPQHVMMKPYPKTGPYMPEGIDDTIRGIDHQMDYDDSQRKRHYAPKKV
jgi:hypothetical protein